jgi:TolB-like protein
MRQFEDSSPAVHFGLFEVDLRAGEIRKGGRRINLQEQPFQVLAALLEQPGEMVSREELQERLWPNETVDFDCGLNKAIRKIRMALGDSADDPRFLQTLPRRGYRFIAPVEQAGIRIDSLAVLPLENLSSDPAYEHFTDGMTDAVITKVARIGFLRVISRTSTLRYKGTRKPVAMIAKELGVDAVVEGAVMHSGQRVRITAQLIRAADDRHLFSEEYERDLTDVLTLQGEVAQAIAGRIEMKLTQQLQRPPRGTIASEHSRSHCPRSRPRG